MLLKVLRARATTALIMSEDMVNAGERAVNAGERAVNAGERWSTLENA